MFSLCFFRDAAQVQQ